MLVRCFECDNEISSEAKICPICGYKGYYWHAGAGETSEKAQRYPSKELARQGLQEEFSQNQARIRANLGPGSAGSGSYSVSRPEDNDNWYIVTCILIAVGIIVFIIILRALILACDGHPGSILSIISIVWFIIKVPFIIIGAIIKAIIWTLDKITVPGLLIIALIGGIAAIIFGNRKRKG